MQDNSVHSSGDDNEADIVNDWWHRHQCPFVYVNLLTSQVRVREVVVSTLNQDTSYNG